MHDGEQENYWKVLPTFIAFLLKHTNAISSRQVRRDKNHFFRSFFLLTLGLKMESSVVFITVVSVTGA